MTHDFDNCPAKPRLEYLEQKEKDQNGTMQRIEAKVDKILWSVIGGLGGVIMALIAAIITGALR